MKPVLWVVERKNRTAWRLLLWTVGRTPKKALANIGMERRALLPDDFRVVKYVRDEG